MFDIVWDIMPDIMHSVVGLLKDKLTLLLGGSEKKEYKKPEKRKAAAMETSADKKRRKTADATDRKRWEDIERVILPSCAHCVNAGTYSVDDMCTLGIQYVVHTLGVHNV